MSGPANPHRPRPDARESRSRCTRVAVSMRGCRCRLPERQRWSTQRTEQAHRARMNEFDVVRGEEPEDVFSPENEARLCEQVLGQARHGL
jgi:hypothetical protein